jgi:hypothetical protein
VWRPIEIATIAMSWIARRVVNVALPTAETGPARRSRAPAVRRFALRRWFAQRHACG